MKIALTGGLGFIGSNLLPALRRSFDSELWVFDNLSNPSGAISAGDGLTVVEGDVRDKAAVEAFLEGADVVVHLAAHTRVLDSIDDPVFNFDVNVGGTLNVLEAMRTHGVKTLVNASTGGAILGEAPPPIHEGIAANPMAPYGASKLAAEGYCSAYSVSYGLEAICLRFSNIYGRYSRNKASVVAAFLKQIVADGAITVYGDGSQTRDFLYAEDLAEGIVAAIRRRVPGVFQLGSGEGTSINRLIEVIREVTGREFTVTHEDFRVGEIVHTHCDISKAKDALGYDPRIGLEEGVARTWTWFQDAGLA